MFNCALCNGPMVPMITTWFCPKDCKPNNYGRLITTVKSDYNGRLWDVYMVSGDSVVKNKYLGWVISISGIGVGSIVDNGWNGDDALGEVKDSGLVSDQLVKNSLMLRFIPKHPDDIEEFKEYM